METIPQELADAVRSAATAASGYPGDLADVHRRVRRRRNRQAALAAAAVVLVTAGVGVAGVTTRPAQPSNVLPAATASPAPSASIPAMGQRLLVTGILRRDRIAEVPPTGQMIIHELGGAKTWHRAVGLPSGGLIAAGPDLKGDGYRLDMLPAVGATVIHRDVRRKNEAVRLLTATATTAYLWRPSGLVAYDLATGTEKSVITKTALGVPEVFDGSIAAADLFADRLALAREQDGCTVRILDGTVLTAEMSPGAGCDRVTDLRLSPDGTMLALVHQDADTIYGVVVFRIADGTVLARTAGVAVDPMSGAVSGGPDAEKPEVEVVWQAADRVRVVTVRAAGADRRIELEQRDLNW